MASRNLSHSKIMSIGCAHLHEMIVTDVAFSHVPSICCKACHPHPWSDLHLGGLQGSSGRGTCTKNVFPFTARPTASTSSIHHDINRRHMPLLWPKNGREEPENSTVLLPPLLCRAAMCSGNATSAALRVGWVTPGPSRLSPASVSRYMVLL